MRLLPRKSGSDTGSTAGIRAAVGEALLSSLPGQARTARPTRVRGLLRVMFLRADVAQRARQVLEAGVAPGPIEGGKWFYPTGPTFRHRVLSKAEVRPSDADGVRDDCTQGHVAHCPSCVENTLQARSPLRMSLLTRVCLLHIGVADRAFSWSAQADHLPRNRPRRQRAA
jgi:hypothetical protein